MPTSTKFDTKSIASLGPKIWNSPPVNIKCGNIGRVLNGKYVSAVCGHIIIIIKFCENE